MEDKYAGQGGTFLIDPKTGVRTLLEQTTPTNPTALVTEESTDGTTSKKDNTVK